MPKQKKVNKFDKYFLFSWRKVLMIIAAWFLAVFLHGVVYGLAIYFFGKDFWGPGGDEAFFFIIAVFVIPLYALAMIVYSLVWLVMKRLKK